MKKQDYEFLLSSWKQLVEQLQDVNESLRNLTIAQHQTILRLQGIQTAPTKYICNDLACSQLHDKPPTTTKEKEDV